MTEFGTEPGIEAELTTGYRVLDFTDNRKEQHEMFAFRINHGTVSS